MTHTVRNKRCSWCNLRPIERGVSLCKPCSVLLKKGLRKRQEVRSCRSYYDQEDVHYMDDSWEWQAKSLEREYYTLENGRLIMGMLQHKDLSINTPLSMWAVFKHNSIFICADSARFILEKTKDLQGSREDYEHVIASRVIDRWNLTGAEGWTAGGYYYGLVYYPDSPVPFPERIHTADTKAGRGPCMLPSGLVLLPSGKCSALHFADMMLREGVTLSSP